MNSLHFTDIITQDLEYRKVFPRHSNNKLEET